jgi:hypothetical protein
MSWPPLLCGYPKDRVITAHLVLLAAITGHDNAGFCRSQNDGQPIRATYKVCVM